MEVANASWLLYLQGLYALWQLIRHNPLVGFVLKLPLWLFFYRAPNKRVFLLNEVYEDLRPTHDIVLSLKPGDKKNDVEIISREGYWVKAKFGHEYIIAHQHQIAKVWATDFHDIFVINKVDINDSLSMATKLSPKDALLKIAGTFKTSEVKTLCIYTPEFGVTFDPKLGGFLATLPLFAQAKGYPLTSLYLTLALLAIDIFKSPLYKLYDGAFECVSLMIKLHVFKKSTWLYLFFSLFSERWAYGDKAKKCVYSGKNHGFLVHTLAIFENEDDYELTFGYGDYQSSYPAPEDQHFIINKKKIYAMPILPRMGGYCKVMCRINSIVTGKVSARVNLYKQPLF